MKKGVWFGLAMMALVVIGLFWAMPSREHMTNGHLGLLMLGLIVVAIMLGFPTAFTLMGLGTMFTWFAYYSVDPSTAMRQTLDLMVQRAYWVMNNDVLISVPLFVFMGYLVERANLIQRLFKGLHLATARIPGALAVATVVTCAIFACASGIIGAVVTLMGLLAFPAMLKAGYNTRLAAGAVTAGGTLGILIPPSVLLILYGATAGVSVMQLYAGAFFPGLMLAGLYIVVDHHLRETQAQRRAAAVRGRPARGAAQIRGRPLPGRQQRRCGAGRRAHGQANRRRPEAHPAQAAGHFAAAGAGGRAAHGLDLSRRDGARGSRGRGRGRDGHSRRRTRKPRPTPGGLQEPEVAGGLQEPEVAGGLQEPEGAGGVQEPPGAVAEAAPAETAKEAAPAAGAAPDKAPRTRVPAPLWFWIVLGLCLASVAVFYLIFDFARFEVFKMLLGSFFPLALLILGVLGSIIAGLATPTEAAAMGSFGGLFLAVVYGQFNMRMLKESVFLTARTSAMVCWLFVGSGIFAAGFALLGGQEIVNAWFTSLDLSPLGFMLLAQVIIFLLGWPLEWTEIIIIFMPIFLPLIAHFNVDPLFFGLIVALNLQTAFLSPPVAMAAFYLKGVSPAHVTLNQIFLGMMPFMVLQILAIFLLYMFPQIGLWLPSLVYGAH